MKRLLLSLAVLTFIPFASTAQEPSATPELDKLNWAKGEWTGKLSFGMPGHDTADFSASLNIERDANFLRCAAKFITEGVAIQETGYIGFDAKERAYKAWTFSNMNSMPRIERGTVTADSAAFVSDPWDAGLGQEMISRTTMTKLGENRMLFLLEFKVDDKWTKAAEGTLTKKTATR